MATMAEENLTFQFFIIGMSKKGKLPLSKHRQAPVIQHSSATGNLNRRQQRVFALDHSNNEGRRAGSCHHPGDVFACVHACARESTNVCVVSVNRETGIASRCICSFRPTSRGWGPRPPRPHERTMQPTPPPEPGSLLHPNPEG